MREAWRIEHPTDGLGPYRSEPPELDPGLDANITWDHPHHGALPPHLGWLEQREVLYACERREDLAQWFSEQERERCARMGYVVARYRVRPDAFYPGNRQVAFHKAHAERIETLPIHEVTS